MKYIGLNKLNEEAGEVVTVIGKLMAYPDGDHPDGKGNLYERLKEEMADVFAAASWVAANNLSQEEHDKFFKRVQEKHELYNKWYSENDGM